MISGQIVQKGVGREHVPNPTPFSVFVISVLVLLIVQSRPNGGIGTIVALGGAVVCLALTRSVQSALLIPLVVQVVFPNVVYGMATYAFGIPALLYCFKYRRHGSSKTWRPVVVVLISIAAVCSTLLTAVLAQQPDAGVMWRIFGLGALAVVLLVYLRGEGQKELRESAVAALCGVAVLYLVQRGGVLSASGSNSWATASAPTDEWLSRNALVILFIVAFIDRLDLVLTKHRSLWNIGMCALFGLATLVTFSRSGYLALAAAVVVLLYRHGKRAIFVALPVIVWFIPWPDSVVQRIEYTSASGALDASSAARVDLWGAAWSVALDHPLLGVGIHSLSHAFDKYGLGDGFLYAHNSYLTVIAALGIVLPTAAIAILAGASWRSRKVVSPRGFAMAAACAVASWFGEPLLAAPVLVLVIVVCVSPKVRAS